MTTTVRLLSTHNGNPPQTIVRLPDATAAAFVAAGNASLDLTGGINKAPPAVSRLVGGAARLLYNAAGTFLGLGDAQGNLLLSASGTTSTNLTAPGAPTSFTLTAAAGAVMGAFTAPASDGGESIDWYEMTLSNGTVVRGDASPLYASAPVGVSVSATVRAVNDVGMSPASNSASATPTGTAPGDTTPPTANAAAVANSTPTVVSITMSEALAATLPAASAFTVSGHTVTGVAISGSVVSLTVTAAFVNGEAARTVSYTKPGTNPITDVAGNQLATFSALAITNNVAAAGDTTPPTANSAAVANSAPTQLVITMSEAMGATLPAASAFAVGGHTVSAVAISGSTVTLTVDAFVNGEAARTVAYTKPGTNPAVDAAGNQLASFTALAVTNNVQAVGPMPLDSRHVAEGDSITNAGTVPSYLLAHSFLTGGRYYNPSGYNQATSAETVAQMRTQTAAVVARQPDIVTFLGGTNDVPGTRTAAEIVADIKQCADDYIAGGTKFVIICKILPRNDGTFTALSTARKQVLTDVNTLLDGIASTKIKITQISASFDPSVHTFDGLHPTWDGSFMLAQAFADVTSTLITTDSAIDRYLDSGNLWPNAALTGTAGTFSGNPVPTGQVSDGHVLNTSGTGLVAVGSKVASANGTATGERIQVSGTPAATGAAAGLIKTVTIPGVIGDAYEAWCQIDLAAGSAFVRSLNISLSGAAQTVNRSVDKIMSALPRSGVMRCPPYVLTTNAASVQVSFNVLFGLGDVAADITISKPMFRKVVGTNAANP